MKYEFRLEIECEPDNVEQIKDWLLDLNETSDENMPVIKEVTYDSKKED